jgi:PAS domain S-box-containing protein
MKCIQKILIVDDKPENLFALEKILSETGAEVISATTGNQALTATLNHDFALAIVDVQMPEMDGYELAEILRNDKRTNHLPIVFLTAVYSDDYHIFKGYDLGAIDFITKPVDPRLLLSKVKVFLEIERQKRNRSEQLARMQELIKVTSEVLASSSTSGLLQKVVDAARELTEAGVASCGHGYRRGAFKVGVVSRSSEIPSHDGANIFSTQPGSIYLGLVSNGNAIRLTGEELEYSPDWSGGTSKDAPSSGILGVPMMGPDGEPNGFIMVSEKEEGDFTEEDEAILSQLAALASLGLRHIEAREDAERRATEMDAVFSSMSDPVIIYNSDGIAVKATPSAAWVYGFDPVGISSDKLKEKLSVRHSDGASLQPDEYPSSKALRGETVLSMPLLFTNPKGRTYRVLATTSPLIDNGNVRGAVALWHDVTEREMLLYENSHQRAFLEKLLDVAPVGIAVTKGPEHVFELANPYYRAIPEAPSDSLVGRKWAEVYPEIPAGLEVMDEVFRTGEAITIEEFEASFGPGRERTFWDTDHIPLKNSEGITEGVLILVHDVTERILAREALNKAHGELEIKVEERTAELAMANESLRAEIRERQLAQDALKQEQEILQTIIDHIPVMLCFYNAAGEVHMINHCFERLIGWSLDELKRLDVMETLYPDPDYRQEVWDYMMKADPGWRDLRLKTKQSHILESSWANVKLSDGRQIGIGIDITERKRSEEEIAKYMAKLQESNRSLQDFASIASHDMQEPLRKIQVFSDQIINKYGASLDAAGKDYLVRMQNAANRMKTLLDALLTYSRVTSKAQPFSPVDLREVVRDIVDDLEVRIEQTKGRVEVGDLPMLDADSTQMRQLFQNLTGNALKFHGEESPVVKIYGRILDKGSHYRIFVEDNGIGFDEKYLERIFAPFQRLHGREEYDGTGMGLAICKKIVERHGGMISAESSPGKGSKFIITLPLRQESGSE